VTTKKMKKFSSFGMVKQAALEKIGKAESHESAEAAATKDELANIRTGYTNLATALKNYCNEGGALSVSQGEIFAEALFTLGGTQSAPLSDALKAVGQAQRDMDNHLMTVFSSTKEQMLAQVQSLVDTDIKKCRDLKAKAETARLKYDTSLSDLKSAQSSKKQDPNKLQKVEEAEQRAKGSYDQATSEWAEATKQLQERVRKELHQQLKDYAEWQSSYFEKGITLWQEALSHFDEEYGGAATKASPPLPTTPPATRKPPPSPPPQTTTEPTTENEKDSEQEEEVALTE